MIIQQDMDLMKKLTVRDWAMRKLAASATVSQSMADVFPY